VIVGVSIILHRSSPISINLAVNSSAGVYSQLSEADSMDSMANMQARNRQRLQDPIIQQWIANTGPTYAHNPPSITLQTHIPITARRTGGAWLF